MRTTGGIMDILNDLKTRPETQTDARTSRRLDRLIPGFQSVWVNSDQLSEDRLVVAAAECLWSNRLNRCSVWTRARWPRVTSDLVSNLTETDQSLLSFFVSFHQYLLASVCLLKAYKNSFKCSNFLTSFPVNSTLSSCVFHPFFLGHYANNH